MPCNNDNFIANIERYGCFNMMSNKEIFLLLFKFIQKNQGAKEQIYLFFQQCAFYVKILVATLHYLYLAEYLKQPHLEETKSPHKNSKELAKIH
jgi:hypothetical protein